MVANRIIARFGFNFSVWCLCEHLCAAARNRGDIRRWSCGGVGLRSRAGTCEDQPPTTWTLERPPTQRRTTKSNKGLVRAHLDTRRAQRNQYRRGLEESVRPPTGRPDASALYIQQDHTCRRRVVCPVDGVLHRSSVLTLLLCSFLRFSNAVPGSI